MLRLRSQGQLYPDYEFAVIHNNQQPADGTLLSAAICEGMADFIAELVNSSLGNNGRLHHPAP